LRLRSLHDCFFPEFCTCMFLPKIMPQKSTCSCDRRVDQQSKPNPCYKHGKVQLYLSLLFFVSCKCVLAFYIFILFWHLYQSVPPTLQTVCSADLPNHTTYCTALFAQPGGSLATFPPANACNLTMTCE
jgi:hypothetical protein